MKEKETRILLNNFINFLIFIKIIFFINVIIYLYLKYFTKLYSYEKIIKYIISQINFIFSISISILLIFIFRPSNNNIIYITTDMSVLFYIFGILLFITSNWELYFKEPIWLKDLIEILK